MANLKTTLCGIEMDNPFVLGSGPLSYGAEGIIAATKAGAGAVVTKTIRREAAINPTPHMALCDGNSILNTEKWSDYPAERWIKEELQKCKEGGVKVLIASIGGDRDELLELAGPVEKAGADIIEISGGGYFDADDLVSAVKDLKKEVSVPVIVKINSNWRNTQDIIEQCLEANVDGITCIDSMGPTVRLDLATGAPRIGGNGGYGWITGAPLLPFTLQIVRTTARLTKKDIIGLGGITKAADALEMLLAGASCCGVCSAAIIRGIDYFGVLNKQLSELMDRYGYATISEVSRKSLQYVEMNETYHCSQFVYDAEKCVGCQRCVVVCPYGARTLSGKTMAVDETKCRACGICFNACNTAAIRIG